MRNKLKHSAVVLALAAATAYGGLADATPFTLNFQGNVTQTVFDPYDPLGGAVHFDSSMYSYLNFDSSATDAIPADPNTGSYTLTGGTYGMAVVIDSVVFPVMHSVNISIANDYSGGIDQYLVYAWEGTQGGLGDFFSMSMLLQDNTGTAFNSDALPLTMPDLSLFTIRTFDITGQYTDLNGTFFQYEIQGNVVPEPGTVTLLSAGLLGWISRNRGKAKA